MKAANVVMILAVTLGCARERSEQPAQTQTQAEQADPSVGDEAYSRWDPSKGEYPPQRTQAGLGGWGGAGTAGTEEDEEPGGVAEFGISASPAKEKQTGIINGQIAVTTEDAIEVRSPEGKQLKLNVPAEALVVIDGAVAGVDQLEQLSEGTPIRVVYSIQDGVNVATQVEAAVLQKEEQTK